MRVLKKFPSLPNKNLLRVIVKRELFSRFRRHRLGSSWIFLSPLLTSLVMITAFYGIFGISEESLLSYSFYVLSGVTIIQFINSMLINVSASVLNAKGIYSKIKVPFLTFPIAVSLVQLVYFTVGILYCLILLILQPKWYVNPFHLTLSVLGLALFLAGVGMFLIVFLIRFPDIGTFLPIFLQALTYILPVFYPESIWPPEVKQVLIWNPFLYFIRAFRDSFSQTSSIDLALVLFASGLVTSVFGSLFLIRNRRSILKSI